MLAQLLPLGYLPTQTTIDWLPVPLRTCCGTPQPRPAEGVQVRGTHIPHPNDKYGRPQIYNLRTVNIPVYKGWAYPVPHCTISRSFPTASQTPLTPMLLSPHYLISLQPGLLFPWGTQYKPDSSVGFTVLQPTQQPRHNMSSGFVVRFELLPSDLVLWPFLPSTRIQNSDEEPLNTCSGTMYPKTPETYAGVRNPMAETPQCHCHPHNSSLFSWEMGHFLEFCTCIFWKRRWIFNGGFLRSQNRTDHFVQNCAITPPKQQPKISSQNTVCTYSVRFVLHSVSGKALPNVPVHIGLGKR